MPSPTWSSLESRAAEPTVHSTIVKSKETRRPLAKATALPGAASHCQAAQVRGSAEAPAERQAPATAKAATPDERRRAPGRKRTGSC